MILLDVNVLVYAHRNDVLRHVEYQRWLAGVIASERAFAVADIVFAGFVRIVTHPRIFHLPTSPDSALAFVEAIRERPNFVSLNPGIRHWDIFTRLCRSSNARGNLVPDAYLAALAIESGSEWVTNDRGYARFPGLRWRDPLADK